jgi:hypothetical protein
VSQAIPVISDCCSPCESENVTTTPGPEGPAGADGAAGADGVNAFTTVADYTPDPFPVMPAEGATVDVDTTSSTGFLGVGQMVFVESWGWMRVNAIPDDNTVTLTNMEDTATGAYTDNAAPGISIAALSRIVPGGLQGPTGATPAGALLAANNLNDVANVAASRTNLGLGTMAVQNASAVAITGGTIAGITDLAVADGGSGASTAAGARTNFGVVIGTDVQAYDAGLQSLSALPTVADRIAYSTAANVWAETALTTFARTLLDDTDAATMRATLGVPTSGMLDMLLYRSEFASGTGGGTFTTGSWVTVPLNAETVDQGNHGSITSNEITLESGTYRYQFVVVGNQVNKFQGRLYNVTDAAVVANSYGSVGTSISGTANNTQAIGFGRFTIAASKTIRLEAQCETTKTTDGFGIGGSFGGGEVFSYIQLFKE